jgi:hypothetical protein
MHRDRHVDHLQSHPATLAQRAGSRQRLDAPPAVGRFRPMAERPAGMREVEAARASLRFGFEQIGLDRIVAYARPDNRPSIRVLEKLGMTFDRRDRVFDLDVRVYATERTRYLLGDGPYEVRPSP